MFKALAKYKAELRKELKNILSFWITRTIDKKNGGFYGSLDNNNTVNPKAAKGSVLNSRILWAFSAAMHIEKNEEYLDTAKRAFTYIRDHFIDKEFGGVYWTVNFLGQPLDKKKQIYALAFAVYGLSEYHRVSGDAESKVLAIQLYRAIIEHSYDGVYGGYIEALLRDWEQMADLRLSARDANEKKSMNTHLHVMEGFVNLYRIWPDDGLKKRIIELVNIFLKRIVNRETAHLGLFFDEAWHSRSHVVSYGHDIEAAWLMREAAGIAGEKALIGDVESQAVKIAEAITGAFDQDGGLWYEFDEASNHLVAEKHSWPQAESMVGFFDAWQISGNESYLQRSMSSWNFIKNHILDKAKGEWVWGIDRNYSVIGKEKVGMWKCPYHNSRACIEIIGRINGLPA